MISWAVPCDSSSSGVESSDSSSCSSSSIGSAGAAALGEAAWLGQVPVVDDELFYDETPVFQQQPLALELFQPAAGAQVRVLYYLIDRVLLNY